MTPSAEVRKGTFCAQHLNKSDNNSFASVNKVLNLNPNWIVMTFYAGASGTKHLICRTNHWDEKKCALKNC